MSEPEGAGVSLRVVVAEDSLLVREGIRRVLESRPGVEVVATCVDLPGLLAAVAEHRPDVVVTDVRMPPTSSDEGIRAAAELRGTHPSTGVLVLSQYAEPGYATALLVAARGSARSSPLRGLTPREREVLAAIAQGRSNASVGQALGLSERAVEKHINALFAKLGLTDEPDLNRRVAAVLLYLRDDARGGSTP
jgi:DNA-binding NarL/FixJ family response regulator